MTENWIDAAAFADVPEGDVIGVQVGGKDIALYEVEGEVFATDNICSHGHAKLCDGYVEGHEVECPFHQGRFDVRTGAATCAPATEAVKSWPVKIEGGRVYLQLSV